MPQEEKKRQQNSPYDRGSRLVSYVKDLFESFKTTREPWELIMEECWYNFIGQYNSNVLWKPETEGLGGRSRAFIKLTTLKCNTAHSKIIDVLFGGRSEVPFGMKPYMFAELGISPEQAVDISEQRRQKIRDHFRRIRFEETVDAAILELCIFGTAILKGPIIELQKSTRVVKRTVGNMPIQELDSSVKPFELQEYQEIVPVIDHVPWWEYYTDLNAKDTKSAIGEIHFQRLLPAQFRRLAYQGGYNKEAVLEAARRATDADENDKRYIQLGDNFTGEQGPKDIRVSTLEFWGLVPVDMLREAGCELPPDARDEDSIEALVVIAADGVLCKVCVNPLGYRPFFSCPFKKRPHVIYGMGVAEMMRDSQKMVNSAVRLMIDNKALSGIGMIAINYDRINWKRTGSPKLYVGKTLYVKQQFAPKDAIETVGFQDVTNGLRELIELFERFSDEETGMPKYTSGQQDSFLNKTATGISMLMGQANINLKTVLRNIDNYWIEPIVGAFNDWFDDIDPAAVPLKVFATGSDSLIAKELKMENYMKFMQVTGANPQDAIFTDRAKLIQNIARILETDDIVRSKEEIKEIMAEMEKQANTPKDMRSLTDMDRLYPLLTRTEQCQFLMQIGIQPDLNQTEPMTGHPPVKISMPGDESPLPEEDDEAEVTIQ